MIGKIKRFEFTPDQPLRTHSLGDGAMWLEVEITGPKSMQGRNIDIYVSSEDVRKLLISTRQAQIEARSQTMEN